MQNRTSPASVVSAVLITVSLVGVIGCLDYMTGTDFGFYIFYFLPVLYAVWRLGLGFAILTSLVSIAVWFSVDYLLMGTHNTPLMMWNGAIRLATFLLLAYAFGKIQEKMRKERDLVDFIVHDLRNLLMVVLESFNLTLEFASERLTEDERGWISMGTSSCKRAITLMNSVLDLSRLEAGKMPIDVNNVDVVEILHSAMSEVVAFAKRSHVVLEERNEIGITNFECDKNLLLRILVNLLSNAVKVSLANSKVSLSVVSEDPKYITFIVKDEGPGIPTKKQSLIFKKFVQLSTLESESASGSGIGLNFVKLATKELGGDLSCQSTEGVGTQFRITFPVKGLPIK